MYGCSSFRPAASWGQRRQIDELPVAIAEQVAARFSVSSTASDTLPRERWYSLYGRNAAPKTAARRTSWRRLTASPCPSRQRRPEERAWASPDQGDASRSYEGFPALILRPPKPRTGRQKYRHGGHASRSTRSRRTALGINGGRGRSDLRAAAKARSKGCAMSRRKAAAPRR